MKLFSGKKLAYAAAFALLFGAYAGSARAWEYYETVDGNTEIPTNETEYKINVSSGNGVYANNTDITIGTEGVTQNISITAGTAIYATGTGSTVELIGTTTLNAATGASAKSGGKITFNDTVTINAATAAIATGTDGGNNASTITFNDALVTTSASTLTASDGGEIYLYDESGSTSYIGTTDVLSLSVTTVGIIDMTLGSGSAWYLTGDSSATTLSNNGLLDMTADGGAYSTLTLDTLTGNGLILMDIGTNGADKPYKNSDIIYVEGENDAFTGQQNVELAGAAVSGLNLSQGAIGTVLMIASNVDGGTLTMANDYEGTLYWQKYEIASRDTTNTPAEVWGNPETGETAEGTEYYISNISYADTNERETTTVSAAISAASLTTTAG